MALDAQMRNARCPSCGHAQSLPRDFAGTDAACSACGTLISVPSAADNDRTVDVPSPVPASRERGEAPPPKTPPQARSPGLPAPGTEDTAPDPLLDSILGKCHIQRTLGEGGMGAVYLGKHLTLDIPVAVKVLPTQLAKRDRAFVDRFLREARTAARIHHPNIVQVLDVDFQNGLYFLVMEYIEGETAGQRLRARGVLPEREVVEIGLDVASALEYARRKGIIHRDVKPENILISTDGEVRLADLGLAKRVAGEDGSDLTLRDQALGTPFYISPEQATNARGADHRSDLYSLGATLFHLATGRPPFQGTSAFDTMNRHLHEPAPALRAYRAECSLELADVVRRLMEKDPAQRIQTAGELILILRGLYEVLVPKEERDAALIGSVFSGKTSAPRQPSVSRPDALQASSMSYLHTGHTPAGPFPAARARERTPVAPHTPPPAAPTPLPARQGTTLVDRLPAQAAYGQARPPRVWLVFLLLPFLNGLSFLYIGASAKKREWLYWGLGLMLFHSLFLTLITETMAQVGSAVIYLAGLVYGFAIRREVDVRILEARTWPDEGAERKVP